MGWEWKFDFEFEHGYPSAEAFEQLFSAVAYLSKSECIPYIEVAERSWLVQRDRKGIGRYAKPHDEKYSDTPVPDAVAMALGLNGGRVLTTWVQRQRLLEHEKAPTLYGLRLYVYPEWIARHPKYPRAAVQYDGARGWRYTQAGHTPPKDSFDKEIIDAAEYNLPQLRGELETMFATIGELRSIRGIDVEGEHNPLVSGLVIHRNCRRFLHDLGLPDDTLSEEATLDMIMKFSDVDPDFRIELLPQGVEVFFEKQGSRGRLKHYYEFVQQQVSSQI